MKSYPTNMAAIDSQTSPKDKNSIEENNKSANKVRSSENADITANGNSTNQGDESDETELGVFIVKKILEAKMVKDIRYYKVRWGDSWEPEANLHGCMEIINEFWKEKEKEKRTVKERSYNGVTELLQGCMELVNEIKDSTDKGENNEEEGEHNAIEDSTKGYSLRQKNDINRKRRKGHGWSSKTKDKKQKKRKVQEQFQSSSDEEGSEKAEEQFDHIPDGVDYDPANLEKFSPQVVLKKVNHRRRSDTKRINKELYSATSSDDGGSDGADDEDEDDNVPLQKFLTPTESNDNNEVGSALPLDLPVEALESRTDAVDNSTLTTEAASTLPEDVDSTQANDTNSAVPNVASLPNDTGSSLPSEPAISANESTSESQGGELENNVLPDDTAPENVAGTSAMSEISGAITSTSTTTTVTSTTHAAEERSNDRLKWQRLGRGTKWDAIICGSDSEDERPVTTEEVKVKEEPISEDDEEQQLFKRSAKLKAKHVIQMYCESGGDANENNWEGDDFIPVFPAAIRQEEDDIDVPYVPNLRLEVEDNMFGSSNFNETMPNLAVPTESDIVSKAPAVITTSMDIIPPVTCTSTNDNTILNCLPTSFLGTQDSTGMYRYKNTTQQPPNGVVRCVTTCMPSLNHCTSTSIPSFRPCTPIKQEKEQSVPASIHQTSTPGIGKHVNSISTATSSSHMLTNCADLFTYASTNVTTGAPLQCNKPIQCLLSDHLKIMVSRVLFLVRKLIEFCRLKPTQVPEHIRALIAKAVVFAVRESYSAGKPEPNFLEEQVNDLTQIVLKELPFEKLLPLLYNYALSNVDVPMQTTPNDNASSITHPIVSLAKLTSSVVGASATVPIGTATQTVNNICGGTTILSPHTIRQTTPIVSHSSPPITFVRHPLMEKMGPSFPNILHQSRNLGPAGVDLVNHQIRFTIPQLHPPQHGSNVNVPGVPQFPGPVTLVASEAVRYTVPIPPMMNRNMESPPPITQINNLPELAPDSNTSSLFNIANVRSLKDTDGQPPVVPSSGLRISKDSSTIIVSSTSLIQKQSVVTNKPADVKTVRGPHRFYRPPKKATPVLEKRTQHSEVTAKSPGNVKIGNDLRYKDLVNQKFTSAESIDDPNKIIDLTDLTVESDKDEEDKDKSDEES